MPRKVVLLIDEIDKADEEFVAFLLEVLSDFQVSVPELGTIRALHRPAVILTSNRARELSEALKRRCLHLYIDFPGFEDEARIIALKVPDLDEKLRRQVARFVNGLRVTDDAARPRRRPACEKLPAATTSTNSSMLFNASMGSASRIFAQIAKNLARSS